MILIELDELLAMHHIIEKNKLHTICTHPWQNKENQFN